MTNDTSLESSCALLLEQICKNYVFYRKIKLYSKNVRKKKFVQKMKNYTVLGLKGGLWVRRKSQKISTASDQYFLSYVKKDYRGGSN